MIQSWQAAVGVELCATFVNVAGKQCFRAAHIHKKLIFYFIAITLLLCGNATSSFAMLLGPNSLVAAVDGMIIVWNILLAPYTLGEAVTVTRLSAAIVITAGTCLTAVFGNHHNHLHTPAQYDAAITHWNAWIYYCMFYPFWFTLLVISCREMMDITMESRLGGGLRSVLAGSIAGSGGLFQKAMVCNLAGDRYHSAMYMPWVYVLFCLWLSGQVTAWYLFSTATKKHEALFCLPLYEACLIASSGIMGYSVLQEAVGPGYEVIHATVGYWTSVTILLSGCYLLVGWPFECDGDREIEECSCHLRRNKSTPVDPANEEPNAAKQSPTEASPLVNP